MQQNSSFSMREALNVWRDIVVRGLQNNAYDLSTRQTGILLTVYLSPPPHTVKSLSETLLISKPAICRALDMLSKLGLLKRKRDEKDNRIVYIQRTVKGSVYLSEFAEIINSAYRFDTLNLLTA
jgi:DNA-binding MarR family transcriptional regulator